MQLRKILKTLEAALTDQVESVGATVRLDQEKILNIKLDKEYIYFKI